MPCQRHEHVAELQTLSEFVKASCNEYDRKEKRSHVDYGLCHYLR